MNTAVAAFGALAIGFAQIATAADIPVQGRRLHLRGRAESPAAASLRISLQGNGIAPPFGSPSASDALVLGAGAAPGQCHAELSLDPAKWHALGGDGSQAGYFYVDRSFQGGVLFAAAQPGRIRVRVKGAALPCAPSAVPQREPVRAWLRLGRSRYCAEFGGSVVQNGAGGFRASGAPAPRECPKPDLTVANLNFLHGATGAGCTSTKYCRLADRAELLFQWIAGSGCPDVVGLQEVWDRSEPLLRAGAAGTCPFPYRIAYARANPIDNQMILSRFLVTSVELRRLFRGFRTALYARIDHPIGPLDVFVTHLASGSDGAGDPCGAACPGECATAGAATVRECQAVQLALFVAERHTVSTPALVMGDWNAEPESFEYRQFTGRGWIDAYLEAGNPECDPRSGTGCTSGRQDQDLSDLEAPAIRETERIDYIFLVPPAPRSACAARIDPAGDADGDGSETGIFAASPNPFVPQCGAEPDSICWPSDHRGVLLDLDCEP